MGASGHLWMAVESADTRGLANSVATLLERFEALSRGAVDRQRSPPPRFPLRQCRRQRGESQFVGLHVLETGQLQNVALRYRTLQMGIGPSYIAGPVVPQLVRLTPKSSTTTDQGIAGDIIGLDDPFGSLISNIPGEDFRKLGYVQGDKVPVQINKKPVVAPWAKTFMDVPVGDALLYIDSRGRVGIAVNQGNYSRKFNITPPATIFIPTKRTAIPPPKRSKR